MAKVEWWGKAMPKHFRVFWLIVELVFSVAIVEAQEVPIALAYSGLRRSHGFLRCGMDCGKGFAIKGTQSKP